MVGEVFRVSIKSQLAPGPMACALVYFLCLYLALAPVVPKLVSYGAALVALIAIFAIPYWRFRERRQSTATTTQRAVFGLEVKWVLIGFCIYVLSAIISLLNNADLDTASWRFESYYPYLLMIAVTAMFLRLGVIQDSSVAVLLYGCATGSVVMAVASFCHVEIRGDLRAGNGTGFDENTFGYIAGLYLIILFAASCLLKGRALRVTLLVLSVVAYYTVYASGSRGVLVALLFALGFLMIVTFFKVRGNHGAWFSYLVGVGLVLGLVLSIWQTAFWQRHINKVSEQVTAYYAGDASYNSISARLSMLDGGLQIWQQHPVIGTGIGDSQNDLNALIAQDRGLIERASFATFHNSYVDALATTGLLGLLALVLSNFLLPLKYFFKTWRASTDASNDHLVATIGVAFVLYHCVFGLFSSWVYLRNQPITLMVLVLLLASSSRFRGVR